MKATPVKGTRDYLPKETEIRDFLQNIIMETYSSAGFQRITTPIIEDSVNLDKSEGGENLNLIFIQALQFSCCLYARYVIIKLYSPVLKRLGLL